MFNVISYVQGNLMSRETWSWNIQKNNHRKEEKTIFLQQGKGESRDVHWRKKKIEALWRLDIEENYHFFSYKKIQLGKKISLLNLGKVKIIIFTSN